MEDLPMVNVRTRIADELWERIEPVLPEHARSPHGGRDRLDDRWCLEGILWILRSGARWRDMPKRFPSGTTCWRRLQEWEAAGVWQEVWQTLLGELDGEGCLDLEETFGDGTFVPAKKGELWSAKPSVDRARN
jgi:transposase